jgi:hypothetical protein
MAVTPEREIYIKASRGFEILMKCILSLESYLGEDSRPDSSEYYRARNLLREGKGFLDETYREAKKLLGPIPPYAPKEFEEWKSRVIRENKLVVYGESLEAMRSELLNDEYLKTIMTPEEINAFLEHHFETQRSGKRKPANIKARMMLDKLSELYSRAQNLQKLAQRKQQGLPVI